MLLVLEPAIVVVSVLCLLNVGRGLTCSFAYRCDGEGGWAEKAVLVGL